MHNRCKTPGKHGSKLDKKSEPNMPSINITASDDKNLLPFQIQSYLIMVSTIICQSTEEQRLEKKIIATRLFLVGKIENNF